MRKRRCSNVKVNKKDFFKIKSIGKLSGLVMLDTFLLLFGEDKKKSYGFQIWRLDLKFHFFPWRQSSVDDDGEQKKFLLFDWLRPPTCSTSFVPLTNNSCLYSICCELWNKTSRIRSHDLSIFWQIRGDRLFSLKKKKAEYDLKLVEGTS